MVFTKANLEFQLHDEKKQISDGRLKEDSPLDVSPPFRSLCEAARKGDLKVCQECMTDGVNINARDPYDYTPLILASLCGQYEIVQLLLEAGALCERDTFQGERCLYNALNDRIRNLLLQYDYSKSADPLQPLASHIASLLSRQHPKTSDITITAYTESFSLHKFLLSARSPYFREKLALAPEAKACKLPPTIAPQAFEVAIRYLYFGDVPHEIFAGSDATEEERVILTGIERMSRQLEISSLWDGILEGGDRRITRQRRAEETVKGRDQLEEWYRSNVLKHKIEIETRKAGLVRWDRDNAIFADVLLKADEDELTDGESTSVSPNQLSNIPPLNGLPLGIPIQHDPSSYHVSQPPQFSTIFPAHRAILIRSEFFSTMFSSPFREAQSTPYLQIIHIDCSPAVLVVVLTFLYTEKADIPLDLAIDVLYAADLLLLEKLKHKAAIIISTLGNGSLSKGTLTQADVSKRSTIANTDEQVLGKETINIYDVLRAGWATRVHRLEEFAARYIAYRLEDYIDEEEFATLIRESARRIKERQETDSIELLDDIRYYLSDRFRLRFEESGIDELMDETEMEPKKERKDQDVEDLVEDVHAMRLSAEEGVDLPSADISPRATATVARQEELTFHLDQNSSREMRAISTLDGEVACDGFADDAVDYRVLLQKIDDLLVKLELDA